MSRSGYSDDLDNWAMIKWRGVIASATRGRRGQKFFRELVAALDAMTVKRLVRSAFERDGDVCALGCVGRARGLSMREVDPDDPNAEMLGEMFDIAAQLAQEVMYVNDEWGTGTPEQLWKTVRDWAAEQILSEPAPAGGGRRG